MAKASVNLCRTYLDLSDAKIAAAAAKAAEAPLAVAPTGGGIASTAAVRDLAAARMHLRGILKQCEASFSDHQLFSEMKSLLEEVVRREEQASA